MKPMSMGYNQFGYVKEPLNPVFRSTAPQTPTSLCGLDGGWTEWMVD